MDKQIILKDKISYHLSQCHEYSLHLERHKYIKNSYSLTMYKRYAEKLKYARTELDKARKELQNEIRNQSSS